MSMKIVLLAFASALLFGLLHSETLFKLEGKIDGIDTGKVELVYYTFEKDRYVKHERVAYVQHGTFSIEGELLEPTECTLQYGEFSISFFLEPSTMKLSINTKNDNFTLEGSTTQDDYKRIINNAKDLYDKRDALFLKLEELRGKENDSTINIGTKIDQIRATVDSMNKEIDKRNLSFIRANLDSHISVIKILNPFVRGLLSIQETRELFDSLSSRVKNTADGIRVNSILKAEENTLLGKIAPDFSTLDLNGMNVTLSDFRGKYVFLDFWATWCPPCIESMPYVKRMYEKFASDKFCFIAISCDRNEEHWHAGAQKFGKNWYDIAHVQSFTDLNSGVINPQDISMKYPAGEPKYFLLDPQGMIIGRWTNFTPSIMNEIEHQIGEIFSKK